VNDLAVSTYSLREQLGDIRFPFRDPAGVDRVLAWDYPHELELADLPRRMRDDLGITSIETVGFQFPTLDAPSLTAFESALAASDVSLVNVALDRGDLLTIDPQRREADLAELREWIARFAVMGARYVRVNPGSPLNRDHGDVPPAHLVDALGVLAEDARRQGARLLVENHGGASSDPAWMLSLLAQVGPDGLGLLLDLGNFDALAAASAAVSRGRLSADEAFADIDLEPVYRQIDDLAGYAELVHVKVHAVDGDRVGPIDPVRAVAILERHGYAGVLTVEYEGVGGDPWAKVRRVLDTLASRGHPAQTPTIPAEKAGR
jgi:sugar phosphate isomerase/epimerase